MSRAVAVIETVSNQAFIFGTNRLREAVGASEMIYAAGVDLVLKALGYDDIKKARERGGLEEFLKEKDGIEPLLIASGKAILIGPEDRLKNIIREVALKALDELPGITVQGAIAPWEDESTAEDLHRAIAEAHRKLNRLRSRLPANDLRFQRLPVVAECASSGLPAHAIDPKAPSESMRVVSAPVMAKRRRKDAGWKRLKGYFEKDEKDSKDSEDDITPKLAKEIDDIEEDLQSRDARWLAVIHADGNGLGQIFLNFLDGGEGHTVQEYIEKYRNFSLALDECTIEAAREALGKVFGPEYREQIKKDENYKLPFIPLIIGGDDLTVICSAVFAVPFTEAFLKNFEEKTQSSKGITDVCPGGLTAAAGIAIVKPHFPFHRAYELAEALLKSAKEVKEKAEGCSALHYHVHFDSSGADWGRIKKRLEVRAEDSKKACLSVQPWVIAPDNIGNDWARHRSIEHLKRACKALQERDDDDEQRLRLPRSQQHSLRDKLFHGVEIAENKFCSIRERYSEVWPDLLPQTGGQKLFFEEKEKDKGENEKEKIVQRTPLLDVMDLVDVGVRWPDDKNDSSASDDQKEEAPA